MIAMVMGIFRDEVTREPLWVLMALYSHNESKKKVEGGEETYLQLKQDRMSQ